MAELYCFGRFALDPIERCLYADGIPLPLGTTDIRLLSALVESAGALVAKEDLVSRVWRRAAVSDNSLYVHINALRKIIGDDCIVNKQGRGYRFVARVQRTRKLPSSRPSMPKAGTLPSRWKDNTAAGLTRLVGRSEQLRGVSKLLARNRLVTLTGPGGIGKTKLALHAAYKNAVQYADGILFVELASLRDANLVLGAVAAALGVEIGENANAFEVLARQLRGKSLLIVLDNCEHVLRGAADFCEIILPAAPELGILATSREALRCSGEQVFKLEPLDPLPAVELFTERAAAADANFQLTRGDGPRIARICHHLDGLPLAIEMVASWAGVLGLATLEAKLHRSGWLHGRTTAPPRHFTLDATLEWSHDLLCEPEQTVLRRLAVMAGNFNLQGAEAVAADVRVASAQIFKHVASLVRKSMIAVTPGPQPRRYRLLETTRVFMSDKLVASGDREATQRRHAQYVLCVIENAIGEWETTSDAVWKDRYGSAMDDLRDALDWAMASDYETAVALAGASWPLWRELSLRVEGRQRLSSAITRIHSGTPPELEARLRRGLGELLANTAAVKKAHAELERAATLYRKMGDPSGLGSSLTRLGYTFFMLDRTDEANRTIAEALKLLEPTRFPRMLATAYSTQVCIESRLGRFAAAREAGEKAVRLCEAAGAIATSLRMEANLVEATFDAGNVDEAISKGRGLAVRLRDSSHSYLRGFVLGVLAAALTARGDLDEALRAAGEAAPLLRDDGSLYWLFDHLALRCGVAGRAADAALLAGYSQAVYRKMDHPREPMGSRAASRLRIILCDVLPDKEIAYLDSMGACLTEDEALTLALTADRNLRRS